VVIIIGACKHFTLKELFHSLVKLLDMVVVTFYSTFIIINRLPKDFKYLELFCKCFILLVVSGINLQYFVVLSIHQTIKLWHLGFILCLQVFLRIKNELF